MRISSRIALLQVNISLAYTDSDAPLLRLSLVAELSNFTSVDLVVSFTVAPSTVGIRLVKQTWPGNYAFRSYNRSVISLKCRTPGVFLAVTVKMFTNVHIFLKMRRGAGFFTSKKKRPNPCFYPRKRPTSRQSTI